MKHLKIYEEKDFFNNEDQDEEVHLEIRLEPHPIDHTIDMNRNEWENMNDEEKHERVRLEFENFLGEEFMELIDDGEITFYEN